MLYRKIEPQISDYFASNTDKVLVVTGARQIGKSYIIRYCGAKYFKNIVEINLISDYEGPRLFENVKTTDDFYMSLAAFTTKVLGTPTPVLNSESSVNLGSVYECAVACQLAANDNSLFYYDNRTRGEVDFLYDDFDSLSVVPIEVKSGKDYKRHVAISRLVSTEEYGIQRGYVLSNSNEVKIKGKRCYVPIYFSLFFDNRLYKNGPVLI